MITARKNKIVFNFEGGKLVGDHHELIRDQFELYRIIAGAIHHEPSDHGIEMILKRSGYKIRYDKKPEHVNGRIY